MKKLLLLSILAFVGCQKQDNSQKTEIPQTEESPKQQAKPEMTFPFCSDNLDYSKKNEHGYFVYTDDFKPSPLGRDSAREFGTFTQGEVEVIGLELKPIGDEHTEPIGKLYTKLHGKVVDSLSVHETIDWEGNYEKRFCISSDKTISISEASNAPDLEQIDAEGNAPVYEASAKATYRIEKNGKFSKISSQGNIDEGKLVK